MLEILKEAAEEEEAQSYQMDVIESAEKLAHEIFEDVLPQLGVSAEKYAGLFVEDKAVARRVGQGAEKVASEQGISVYRAVEDIISVMSNTQSE